MPNEKNGCGSDCFCSILECLCKCLCDGGGKSPCACGNGEVRLNVTAPSNPILITNDGSFLKLPPNLEFSTALSGHELDFDDGGAVARLRFVGTERTIIKVDATASIERVRPSIDQHIVLALNVGPAPLSAGSVAVNTRQKTDMQSDGEDIVSHVQGTFEVGEGDLIEVWVAKEDPDPNNEAHFKVTGFVLTAIELRRVEA